MTVVGVKVSAGGEFGEDAVVESQLLLVVEDTWEKGVYNAVVALKELRTELR